MELHNFQLCSISLYDYTIVYLIGLAILDICFHVFPFTIGKEATVNVFYICLYELALLFA